MQENISGACQLWILEFRDSFSSLPLLCSFPSLLSSPLPSLLPFSRGPHPLNQLARVSGGAL